MRGSPVHTGIDPEDFNVTYSVTGFPRTHGDRPFTPSVRLKKKLVPPYTRG